MKQLFSKFMALPIPGKAMLGMIVGGGVVMIVYMVNPQLAYFVGIGMIVLVFVLAAVAMLMKKLDKGKAKAVEEKVSENAATTGGVSKVGDRAKLDDLRKQFETGIQTFKDYGKDLYSMPWYALVGEPGSGKTEAIRHSGIGFPPGLQDQLQGTGGTVNMNWWFTDHAVILDTAGRLMFEEIMPGETNEWREFLKLLRTVRANCPMNGMLLVIPADTLITDTPDEIEKKAGKIAQQFDMIQRTLGVRFPVFVLITKSDLINGFREFFDDITDPVLTAQMLGWSNPDGLDEPFRPDRVEEHLQEVRQRLLERRFALLHDPIHTEDPRGRRIDQVDALYKFPEALAELGPRLRRYLEMIFVAGEWSQKPLFLRGIYFTSSMREGDALDSDLANVLGVSVESLPEGKLWERERSYFLRDMFLDKVFKERGLVTRAANAGQVKRKRSMILLAAGAVTALLLAGVTWWSWHETTTRISEPTEYWVSVEKWLSDVAGAGDADQVDSAERLIELISPFWVKNSGREFTWENPVQNGTDPAQIQGKDRSYGELFSLAQNHYTKNSSSTGLFGLIANLRVGGGDDVFKQQLDVQRRLFEELLVAPAIGYARDDLIDDGQTLDWSSESGASSVLGSLFSVEADRVFGRDRPSEPFDLLSLVKFFLASEDPAAAGEGAGDGYEGLTAYFDWLYEKEKAWPPETAGIGSERSEAAIDAGIEAFNTNWLNPGGQGTLYGRLRDFKDAAESFGQAERLLHLSAAFENAKTVEAYNESKRDWLARHDALLPKAEALRAAFDAVREHFSPTGLAAPDTLKELARDSIWESAAAAYDRLLTTIDPDEKLDAEKDGHGLLAGWYQNLDDGKGEAKSHYESIVAALIDALAGGIYDTYVRVPEGAKDEAFEVRLRVYTIARSALESDGAPDGVLRGALTAVNGDRDSWTGDVGREIGPGAEGEMARARSVASAIVRVSAAHRRYRAVGTALTEVGRFESRFDALSKASLPDIRFTSLSRLDYKNDYQPGANRELLSSFAEITRVLDDPAIEVLDTSAGTLAADLGGVRTRLESHVEDYLRFWAEDVPRAMRARVPDESLAWSAFQSTLVNDGRFLADEVTKLAVDINTALQDAKDYFPDHPAAADYASVVKSEADLDAVKEKREAMLDRWRGLRGDSARAQRTLLRAAKSTGFLDDYFALRPVSSAAAVGPEQSYWHSFFLVGLTSLAEEAGDATIGKVNEAERLSKRFPITLDADPSNALTAEQIEGVHAALAELDLRVDVDAAGEPDPFVHFPDEIEPLMKQLRGDPIEDDPVRARRLRRVRDTAKFLIDHSGDVEFMFGTLGIDHPGNERVWEDCAQCRVSFGGSVVVTEKAEYAKFDVAPKFISEYRFDLPLDGPLELSFINRSGAPSVSARLEGWGPLAALASGEVNTAVTGAEGGAVWPLTLRLSNGAAYSIAVRFLPTDDLEEARENWPKRGDWPRD